MSSSVTTEVPETGTRLHIDADRPFDRHAGDGVLRVAGYSPDGSPVFDAAYAELDQEEAQLLAWLCRNAMAPTPETRDRYAQEVQATFSSKLSGRDAHQVADIIARAQWDALQEQMGIASQAGNLAVAQRLAERFERTAAAIAVPAAGTGVTGDRPQKRGGNGG